MTFEVAEDLAHPGCPVCRGARRAAWDWVHGLLHDNANDPGVRDALERSGGLCPDHTRMVVEVAAHDADSLGLGIVMEFLLTFARRRLDGQTRETAGRGRRRRRPPRPLTAWSCGACEAEARRTAAYLEILTQTSDDEMRRATEDPDRALCLIHLSAAIAQTGEQRDPSLLIRTARRRAEALHSRVVASLQAHGFTAGHPAVDDAVLWREAPDWLAGSPRRIPPVDAERGPR